MRRLSFLLLIVARMALAQAPSIGPEALIRQAAEEGEAALVKAEAAYAAGLKEFYESYKAGGNLDGVLAADAEIKRFELMGMLDNTQIVAAPPGLRDFQTRQLGLLNEAVAAKMRGIVEAHRRADGLLESQERQFTSAGRIPDATAVREQRNRLKQMPEVAAALAYSVPAAAGDPAGRDAGDDRPRRDSFDFSKYSMPVKSSDKGYLWTFENLQGPVFEDAMVKLPLEIHDMHAVAGHAGKALGPSSGLAAARIRTYLIPHNFPGRSADTRGFTVAAWVWVDQLSSTFAVIRFSKCYSLKIDTERRPIFSVHTPNGEGEVRAPRLLDPGKWQHVAASWEFKSARNCMVKLYLNGDLVLTRSDIPGPLNVQDGEPVQVGTSYAESPRRREIPSWRIDDLLVVPRVLNGFEVKALAK